MNSLMSNHQILSTATLLFIIIFLFVITFRWKKIIDKKNMQLMQLYMELNFLYKNISDSLTNECRVSFCGKLIDSIKEYYNLEDIIVADSVTLDRNDSTIDAIKKAVVVFLFDNEPRIKNLLREEEFVTRILEDLDTKYVLYIFPIDPYTSNSGFVICVESYPSLLSKSELTGLKSNVSLLRAKLLSD